MKTTIKRAGIILLTLAFSMLPTLSASATADKSASNDELTNQWMTQIDQSKIYCDEGAAQLFATRCSGAPAASLSETDARYIDITVHAGAHGHFETESGNTNEYTVNYFRGDAFDESTIPVADDPSYVFVGWSTKATADDVDIVVGATTASAVGSDAYAVWSNKSYVYYYINNGFWIPDGSEEAYQAVLMEYDANTNFRALSPDPIPMERYYDFDGWYAQMFGSGQHYTDETIINQPEVEVYAKWKYNPAKIDNELVLGQMHDITVGVSTQLYKFTPTETGYYEIFTEGIEEDGSGRQGVVRIQDVNDHTLAIEKAIDPTVAHGNVHTYYKMQAGTTYYVRFAEMEGAFMQYQAGIRKADMATVTFHANYDSDAWFDGDHSVTSKSIDLPVGDNIARYLETGLEYNDNTLSFIGWTLESDADRYHNALLVDGPMDVYAFWSEFENIYLDFNGGYHPLDGESSTSYVYRYQEDAVFETPIDPKINDSHRKFAGWSRNPNASEPDADIVELVTPAATFKDQTLYAIYTEKVLETYIVTDGGYMMDNPNITTYQTSSGKGHVFYGMAVRHNNPKMKAIGWTDQNGVVINTTAEVDPYYHVDGDSTYTVIWGYELTVFADEGRFEKAGSMVARISFPYDNGDGTFHADTLNEVIGEPTPLGAGRYFIGWATDPDLEEPDIIDGVTRLEDLNEIYGIWSDEEYNFVEGADATWAQSSKKDQKLVIKRAHDDRYTYRFFDTVFIDGEEIATENYDVNEGSLILILHEDYLDTLALGEHSIVIRFANESSDTVELDTTITITEPEEEEEMVVPSTADTGANFKNLEKSSSASITTIIAAGFIVAICGVIFIHSKRQG